MKLKPQIYRPWRRSSMSKLSEDLIFEILSWLPATTLVRFRFVSKSWFNVITTSSCFIQSQLDRGSRIDNPSIFFYNIDKLPSTMEFKDQKGKNTPWSPPSLVKSAVLPMESMVYKPVIAPSYCVGSCNGLICFNLGSGVIVRPSEHERQYIDDSYYLWNPSTNEFKHVPSAPLVTIPSNSRVFVGGRGFGYDRGLADYKVVSIVAFSSNDHTNIAVELMVYTLGTNSWRNARHGCDKSKLCKPAEISGLEVNGSLHWIGRNWGQRSRYCLMSFDIADESFEEVPAPPCFTDMHHRPTLHVLRDCLCVLLNSCRDGSRVEVWMMKDYGVKESWVKLFSTTHPNLTTHGRISNLLWICKNGEIQVQIETSSMAGSFVLYNPKTGEVKFLKWPSPHSYRGRVNTKVYYGSLVHLKSGEILRSATLEGHWHRLAELNTRLFTYCL